MAKSKYDPAKLILVEGWARDGLIDAQIAKNLGISVATLNEWKKRYPEFLESIKRGKEVVDREVENALLKRAMGYFYDEVTYENGVEVKRVTKHVPPDPTSNIFWLKNRKPEAYRDKREVEHSSDPSRPVEVKTHGDLGALRDLFEAHPEFVEALLDDDGEGPSGSDGSS